jgi:hypothetical protein
MWRLLFLATLTVSLAVEPALAQVADFTPPPALADRRSTFLTFLSCYDARDLHLLNCGFTYRILGLRPPPEDLENNGGHKHDFITHPIIDNREGAGLQLLKDGVVFAGTLDPVVSGQTDNNVVVVLHNLPQVTGQIETRITIVPPSGYFCLGNCQPTVTLDVSVEGLLELEAGGPGHDHIIVRSGTVAHPKGSHGVADTLDRIRNIAGAYMEVTQRQLSLNDISLPKGGMFDLNSNFSVANTTGNGHVSHRKGIDVDINSLDGGGVQTNCLLYNKDLQDALLANNVKLLICYAGGSSHVRF